MDIIIEGVLVHDNEIEVFPVTITSKNHKIIKEKLLFEREKLINYLKKLKSDGKIKSILRPKNKNMQQQIDNVCEVKKRIKKSIEKIDAIYP